MKELTNIRCPCSNFGRMLFLDKEYWGRDYTGEAQYHLSCQLCGFSRTVPDSKLQVYIFCDSVMDV